jgi:hypothetical protein
MDLAWPLSNSVRRGSLTGLTIQAQTLAATSAASHSAEPSVEHSFRLHLARTSPCLALRLVSGSVGLSSSIDFGLGTHTPPDYSASLCFPLSRVDARTPTELLVLSTGQLVSSLIAVSSSIIKLAGVQSQATPPPPDNPLPDRSFVISKSAILSTTPEGIYLSS